MSTSHDETIEQPPTQQPEQNESNGVGASTSNDDVAAEEGETAQPQSQVETSIGDKDVPQIEVEESTAKVDSEDEVDAIAGEGTATPAEPTEAETESYTKAEPDADKRLEAQSTGTKESDASIPPGIASSLARPPTPSSRTSTPPLNSSSGAKKFSSVNVNKKFLSKTVTPAAGSPAGGAKLGLSSTSPVPISTTSRLLSTKLTTVPSKTSQSPLPTSSATSTPSSSPWAKPALIEPESNIKAPAPTKARVLSSIQPVTMGSGQGIAVAKAAWRPVTQEGKRGVGLSRDFPTAKEVADGKRDAAAIAQAKAAHNQAIMQELNAFTQLDPNARHWEDDDDDDEVIDFGDGIVYPHHDHPPARPVNEAPVTKSERFVEDFDRSWPRQRPAQIDETTTSSGLPRRPEHDRDRVLFNANSNRLEPPSSRPQMPAQPQPTRLMSRTDTTRPAIQERSLPPHLQGGDGGRALPPHMLRAPGPSAPPAPSSRPLAQPTRPSQQAASSVRQPWGAQREDVRAPPPHLQAPASDRNELPPQPIAHPAQLPPHAQPGNSQRRSFSQLQRPSPPQQTVSASPQAQAVLPALSPAAQAGGLPPKVDDQTAEMHSAAEKARLRRLAEEQEREAAAERARRKAKELEERLGLKNAAVAAPAAPPAPPSSAPAPAAPSVTPAAPAPTAPAPTAPRAGFTLAQRPQPTAQPPLDRVGSGGLPARPSETRLAGREAEGSWRTRVEQPAVEAKPEVSSILARAAPARGEASLPKGSNAPGLQTRTGSNVAPILSRDLPPHAMPSVIAKSPIVPSSQSDVPADIADTLLPAAERPQKREQTFDNMLARIQAAMKEARTTPTAIEEIEAIVAEVVPPSEVAPAAKALQQYAAPPAPQIILPESNITQTDLPKSPPPAWRTYTVRIPKSDQSTRPALPLPRIRAFENYRTVNPKGWLMSFDPPIEGLSSTNLSRSEHFLPAVKTKRFGKTIDASPMVSISPRTLEPFVKKDKKKSDAEKELSQQGPASVTVGGGGASVAEALLGGETVVSAPGEALRRSQTTQEAQSTYPPQASKMQDSPPVASRAFPRATAPSAKVSSAPTTQPPVSGVQSNRWSSDKLDAIAQPIPKPPAMVQSLEAARKPKSPVKQSLAAKAEKDGLFAGDAVGIRNPDQRERALSDAKPGQGGVRFMVSSELEGDSLLDEVNKISLEMVGEGVDGRERSEGKSGVDAPGTPAKVPTSTRTGTSPTSASTWSNGPVRSTPHGSQHDLMKSMWEQTPAGGSTKEASTRADQYISPLVPSTSNTDIATPMYPSLNAPSSADTSSQSQALSAGMKMPYASQQAFSPPGGAQQQPYARSPQYPGTSGTYSPDPHSMYGRSTPGSVNGIANGAQVYGMHQQHQQQIPQAVWSPSAFGAGYGYTNKSTPPVGDKAAAAMAFASASPVGGADYRYGAQGGQGQAGTYGYGHGHAHGAHQHQQHGQNQAYGAGGYGRQQVTSPVNHGYGYYGAGAGGQRGAGRFGAGANSNANANAGAATGAGAGAGSGAAAAAAIAAGAGAINGEHAYGYGGLEGGYYGGVGGGNGAAGGHGHGYGYAQGGHGAIGSQQQQQLLLQQQQQHLQAAQARAGALSAQQRKMWG